MASLLLLPYAGKLSTFLHETAHQTLSPFWANIALAGIYGGLAWFIWSQVVRPFLRKLLWKPPNLKGKIACVTGASRGIGKGIALGLAEAGCTVYITGRSSGNSSEFGTSLQQTADEIQKVGGIAKMIVCDHSKDEDVEKVFKQIFETEGRLDILVNNVFNVPDGRWNTPFWEQKMGYWDATFPVGVRCHYLASCIAAEQMVKQKAGLIVNISSIGGTTYLYNVPYGAGKAATDKMSIDMAKDLKKYGVAAVSLWPGVVKTEYILKKKESYKKHFWVDIDQVGETPLYTGRAIATLASLGKSAQKYGSKPVNVGDLASLYGFTDSNGYQYPPTLTLRFAILWAWSFVKGSLFKQKSTPPPKKD